MALIFHIYTSLTLPETNIAPENRPPGKGDSYWKPSFLGAKILVSGRVFTILLLSYWKPFFFGSFSAAQRIIYLDTDVIVKGDAWHLR